MVRFAIAIPDSACFQAFWAEEAETGEDVHSPAVCLIRFIGTENA